MAGFRPALAPSVEGAFSWFHRIRQRMGQGRDLGMQLRHWLASEPEALRSSRAISNRLIDALGAHEQLKGPIRDLAAQPLLLQVLHGNGAQRRTGLISLQQQLAATYAQAVLQELLDLLAAATDQELPTAQASEPSSHPRRSTEPASQPALARTPRNLRRHWQTWQPILLAVGPGLALAASGALVLAWLARELDQAVFDGWGWSGGVVLVLVLGLIQALSLGPLQGLHRLWPLESGQALQPRQAWRWLGAAWIHERHLEAALNLLLLLVLLGDAAAPLGDVVLRYSLTALATLTPAAILAAHWQLQRQWSGGAGPISALIALAAGLSLLHGQPLTFHTPLFSVPAWVLLLVNGALQLHWQLPSGGSDRSGTPLQRLLCSQWAWGLIFGLGWAVVTWAQELLKATGARP